ncbi:MAG: hypothetical protein ABW186_08495 [Rhodanobacteraceae bacterium]
MIRFSVADCPAMRLDDLQDVLRSAEEAEDAAVIALASYGSRGGGDPVEFEALLEATANARAATAAAYAAWRAAADRVFAVKPVAWATAPGARNNVYPITRRREIGAASPGATSAPLFASMGIVKASDGEP